MNKNTETAALAISACQEMFNCSQAHAHITDYIIDIFFVSKALIEAIISTPAIQIGDAKEISGKHVLKQVKISLDHGLLVTLLEDDISVPTERALEHQWSIGG